MSGIGTRVKSRREQLGLSVPELARRVGGIKYQTIQAIEKGGQTKHVLALARALMVNPNWLESGRGEMEAENPNKPFNQLETNKSSTLHETVPLTKSHGSNVSQELLEVRGMVEGGPDGWNIWNGEIVQYIQRPDNLRGVPNAYAVYVTGNSMWPRYEHGEIAHVHPGRPVLPGAYVVVQRKPKHEGDAPLAVIKKLVRRTATKVILAQINPEKEIPVPADEIVSIHKVVGSSEA